jgi:DNA-binding response OmpR family regulator
MALPAVIVEDNATSADIALRQLAPFGFEAQIAETAQDGWSLIQQVNPVLVVIDERLPDMSGIELIRQLRETNADLAIIMSTIVDDEGAINNAFSAGCNFYCIKPNGLKKLFLKRNNAQQLINATAQELYSK